MKYRLLLAPLLLTSLLAGCASSGPGESHVLSGDMPVDRVVSRADAAAAAGDYNAASVLYRQALRQKPEADTWYRLGLVHMQLGQPDHAMYAYTSALRLDPDHINSLEAAGLYLTAKDRAAQARPHLERLLELEPQHWRAHNALGVLADLDQSFDEAAQHYARAIEINPESPMLWNNLGFSYYLAGDYDAAVRHIAQAVRLDPNYKSARHNIALVFARQARYDDALQMMLSVAGEAQAYCDVGYLAYKMGDYRKAENLLVEAIRRSGSYHRQAHQNLAAVRQAMGGVGG